VKVAARNRAFDGSDMPFQPAGTVGQQQHGVGFGGNEKVGDFSCREMVDPDFHARPHPGQIDGPVRLGIEAPVLVEIDLQLEPLLARREYRHVRQTVAIDIAEGGGINIFQPADHLVVLAREPERRVGLGRRHLAPSGGFARADAGVDEMVRRAVAMPAENVIGLERVEFLEAVQHVGGPEIDAAGIAERAIIRRPAGPLGRRPEDAVWCLPRRG
jgi:hypothetical protein